MNSRGRLPCYAKREAVSITKLKAPKGERNIKATVEIAGSKRGPGGIRGPLALYFPQTNPEKIFYSIQLLNPYKITVYHNFKNIKDSFTLK